MFNSENMRLRRLERDDLPLLKKLKADSWEFTHRVSLLTNDIQEKWFERLPEDPHQPSTLILIAETGFSSEGCKLSKRVGCFKIWNIDWISRTAEVGWDIFKEYRGNGLGKTLVRIGCLLSFQVLNLNRIECEILETNGASRTCAENAGFVLEGTKRNSKVINGKHVNSHMFGLLASEYTKTGLLSPD